MDLHVAGPGDVPTQLERLYQDLSTFCQTRSIPLHLEALTRTLLNFSKDADYPVGLLSSSLDLCFVLDILPFPDYVA